MGKFANKEKVTRIVEYKKFTLHKSKNTLLGLEIPSLNGKHYPIPVKAEQKKAEKSSTSFNLMARPHDEPKSQLAPSIAAITNNDGDDSKHLDLSSQLKSLADACS